MKLLNFPDIWNKWIKECISTASTNVLVNGSSSGEFQPERGIRQGNPLSPFLFLIAAEGLNLLVRNATREGKIRGGIIGREIVLVSHLQYADDTIFALDGDEQNMRATLSILKKFKVLSGLTISFEKSCLFGVNVDRGIWT